MHRNGDTHVTERPSARQGISDPAPLDDQVSEPLVDEAGVEYEPVPQGGPDAADAAAPDEAELQITETRRFAPGRMALVIVLVAILLGLLAYGALAANDRWGAKAMVRTGVTGIEALIQGRADKLALISDDVVRKQLTQAVRNKMSASGLMVDFAEPTWNGTTAVVKTDPTTGAGTFVAQPADDGSYVVVYQTMGVLSNTTGAIVLERAWSGWVIKGLTVKQSTMPSTSTVSPSNTTTGSTTK